MPCEAWKWLAIVSGGLTIVGFYFYDWHVFGMFWPRRDSRQELFEHREQVRRYFPLWALCGTVALVSLVVYTAHCL
jgi:hypothetical protein